MNYKTKRSEIGNKRTIQRINKTKKNGFFEEIKNTLFLYQTKQKKEDRSK